MSELKTIPIDVAARKLGMRINTIYLLLREGRLNGKKIGNRWQIDENSVLSYRRRSLNR